MSFDTDLQSALMEAEAVFGGNAVWTPDGGSARTITGVFNAAQYNEALQDAGIQPGYEATYVCHRAQFTTEPAVDETLEVEDVTYRIQSLTRDSVSLELRLHRP